MAGVADEASREQDPKRLLELTKKLVRAVDESTAPILVGSGGTIPPHGADMINSKHLLLGANALGDEVRVCGHCSQRADEAETVQAQGQLVYTLKCPLGQISLGVLPSLVEKNLQLAAYKKGVKK